MKPTKKQKLEWISKVLRVLLKCPTAFTCCEMKYAGGPEARDWYENAFKETHGEKPEVEHFDDNCKGDHWLKHRINYLAFLHLWVSTGEVE